MADFLSSVLSPVGASAGAGQGGDAGVCCLEVEGRLTGASFPLPGWGGAANKHKPWIEAEYQGIVMENDNTVLLNPPLFALDKDAPLRYAGKWGWGRGGRVG